MEVAMSRPVEFTEVDIEAAKRIIAESKGCDALFEALSVMISVVTHATLDQVAEIIGRSRVTVSRMRKQMRLAAKKPAERRTRRGRGGRRRQLLSLEEEDAFLRPWIEEAKTGGILVVPPIHRALEQRVGRKVATATTYNMLARHNWRKIQPDTRHPKANEQAQEAFKKTSPTSLRKRATWQPPEGCPCG
jgi:transposase